MSTQIEESGDVSTSVVHASEEWSWSISLSNLRGKCAVGWSTDAPFRAQQARVQLIEMPGGKVVAWSWATGQAGTWDSKKDYGPGWAAELTAEVGKLGDKRVVVLTTPTTTLE